MENEKAYLLKLFDPETDYEEVCKWWTEREMAKLPLAILPKLGVMAIPSEGEPADAAAWLYLDNSVGVCFLEGTITRPGLNLHQARAAVESMVAFLKARAREMNYGTMITFAGKALARESKRAGFIRVSTDLSMLVSNISEEVTKCQ